ncbi:hypothetical protein BDU57DRAFT_375597 [Ampelomyces quisqualis]|uniref:Uncharacterized protein n=1 Tax=Ampelomyces quisqualis TaxID=50730 RepID=A0A6A5QBI7_AMPQU|nr:hypothetical protein BDU57DRAFT_375597 [Ampelomyces quisqualis]
MLEMMGRLLGMPTQLTLANVDQIRLRLGVECSRCYMHLPSAFGVERLVRRSIGSDAVGETSFLHITSKVSCPARLAKISRQKISHGACVRSSIGRRRQLLMPSTSLLLGDAAAPSLKSAGSLGPGLFPLTGNFALAWSMRPRTETPCRGDTDLRADIYKVRAVCSTVEAATPLLQGPGVLMLQAEVACHEPRTRKPLKWKG